MFQPLLICCGQNLEMYCNPQGSAHRQAYKVASFQSICSNGCYEAMLDGALCNTYEESSTLHRAIQSSAGAPALTHAWSTPPKYPGTPTSPGLPSSSGAVQTWSRAAANQVRADI